MYEEDKVIMKSPLQEHLEIMLFLMEESVILNPNSAFACYFYNCKKTSENCEKNMYQYFPLNPISIEIMKQIQDDLDQLNQAENRFEFLREKFPIVSENSEKSYFSDVLIQMKKELIFNEKNFKRYTNKRIFLITDNDDPYNGQTGTALQGLRRNFRLLAADLSNAKINIFPFFLNKSEKVFDSSGYYDILYMNEIHEFDPMDMIEGSADREDADKSSELHSHSPFERSYSPLAVSDLKKLIIMKTKLRRVHFLCEFQIGKGIVIDVKGFSLFRRVTPKKTIATYTDGEMVRPTVSKMQYATKDGTPVNAKSDIIRAYIFGDQAIRFSAEQIVQMRNFDKDPNDDPPLFSGLKIIGFRTITKAFRYQYSAETLHFLTVANFNSYSNAFRAFSALYQSCRKLGKAAIVWGSPRVGVYANLYALIPTSYPGFSDTTSLGNPQGFYMFKLPFQDRIRGIPKHIKSGVSNEQLKKAFKSCLEGFVLKNGYVPSEYESPTLRWHYKVLNQDALLIEPEFDAEDVENEKDAEKYFSLDITSKKLSNIYIKMEQQRNVYNKMIENEIEVDQESAKKLRKFLFARELKRLVSTTK